MKAMCRTKLIIPAHPTMIKNIRDNDYNIDHILKEKLECIGQLLDVMDVVDDAAQLFSTNGSTNDKTDASTSNKTDDEQTQTQT